MKVLLVDDEILVRTKLKYLLEVEIPQIDRNAGFILCGEASNGEEALDKIDKLQPDIIISDMKMPVMDGLALCRICRERHPECAFLVLSNYDDFSYVKETLLLGAVDYLLKHSLDAEKLLQALNKVLKSERIKEIERSGFRIAALREDVVRNLLGGIYLNELQIASDINTFDLYISLHQVLPVLMWIREYKEEEFKRNNNLAFSVKNIVNEILEDQKNGVICHINREKYAILLGYEEIRSEQKIRELLLFSLNRIRFCMNSFLGLSVNFIVGRIQPSILTAGEEYHILETEFQNSFYQEKDVWISDLAIRENKKQEEIAFSSEHEKQLIYGLVSGNEDAVQEQLKDLFERIMEGRPSEMVCKLLLVSVMGCVKKAAQECAVNSEDIFHNGFSEENILKKPSFRTMHEALTEVCDSFFAEKRKKNQVTSVYLQKAVAYIHQHFRENISQTEAAEYAGISPVYLSILFKNEMKDTFPVFLRRVRLKEAQRLLERGNTNLKEVADQSGFQDYTYFLKCFKKEYSCTPKEYMKKLRIL